jgi:hydroxypyruvate reductase 1
MWSTDNPSASLRVIVTRNLPGSTWKSILCDSGCRIETWKSVQPPHTVDIIEAIGDHSDGVIGQLTESWDDAMLARLADAGGRVYGNYAVGFNNVDVVSASRRGIAVTNTPGVLTTATAELAVGLTLAAARRLIEGDVLVRSGRFTGWEPDLLLGTQLSGKVLGVVGAGRIGTAYALMMVRGFGMSLVYHGPNRKPELEAAVATTLNADSAVTQACRYEPELDDLLRAADVVSLHPPLNESSHHLLNRARLRRMRPDAILVNVSRGPVVDEAALVDHCRENPVFRVGLDVFEDEPALAPGLSDLPNVVLAPHIGSASTWTRESMSVLAARNVAGVLRGYPVWEGSDFEVFLSDNAPEYAPSVVNPEVMASR